MAHKPTWKTSLWLMAGAVALVVAVAGWGLSSCGSDSFSRCGNGLVEGSETCDDGNIITESCNDEGCEVCSASCRLIAGQPASCNLGDSSCAQDISVGWMHACLIDGAGAVRCWGNNDYGQLNAPSGSFLALSAGWLHSCAIRAADNTLVCWGHDALGRLNAPEGPFVQVSAGGSHNCAVTADGDVSCWDRNTTGQSSPPDDLFEMVSAGVDFTCGVRRDDHAMICWGRSPAPLVCDTNPCGYSEYGTGFRWELEEWRRDVVSVGLDHVCGLYQNRVFCWGDNRKGNLDSPDGDTFQALSAGGEHTCSLRQNGTVACWGTNTAGQLDVPAESAFRAISSGWDSSCGITTNDSIVCWGNVVGSVPHL